MNHNVWICYRPIWFATSRSAIHRGSNIFMGHIKRGEKTAPKTPFILSITSQELSHHWQQKLAAEASSKQRRAVASHLTMPLQRHASIELTTCRYYTPMMRL